MYTTTTGNNQQNNTHLTGQNGMGSGTTINQQQINNTKQFTNEQFQGNYNNKCTT